MTAPLRLLLSYHYHRDTDLAELAADLAGPRAAEVDLFADSGAYSAYSTGATINLADYAAWLTDWAPLLTTAATLDVIGDPKATAANTARLHNAGHQVLPTFHVGSPWPELDRLCAAHPYVALGGMVPHTTKPDERRALAAWLIKAFRIARATGTVFHGFGLTSASLVKDLPFYSVDSSSYTFAQRFGLIYLWDAPALAMRSVFFRNAADVRAHRHLFEQHGIHPGRALHPDFLRPGTPAMAGDRDAITAACARAFQLMEPTLRRRHRVTAPPLPRAADTGTKVYLALSGSGEGDRAPLRLLRTPEAAR